MKKKMGWLFLLGIFIAGNWTGVVQGQTISEEQNEGSFFLVKDKIYFFKKYPPKKYKGYTLFRAIKTKTGYEGYYR